MAEQPSGSGGQQPSEYDYGQQWRTDPPAPAETGAPGGYEVAGGSQDAWGNPAQEQQNPNPYGYTQDPYYGGYEQQGYAQQGYGEQQGYAQQDFSQQQAGYGGQDGGQDQVQQPGGQGYGSQEYGANGYAYGEPGAYPAGGRAPGYDSAEQGYQDYAAQSYAAQSYAAAPATAPSYADYQQQPPTVDSEATQQWQAPDYSGSAPSGEPWNAFSATTPAATPVPASGPGAVPVAVPDGSSAQTPRDSGGHVSAGQDAAGRGSAGAGSADRAGAGSADGRPDRRTLLMRTAIGVTALAVLTGIGIYAAGGDDSSGPVAQRGGAASARFSVDRTKAWSAPPAAAGAEDALIGSWLLARSVVRADGTGVHAYDLTSGKHLWTLQPPRSKAVPCGMSPAVNADGIGAVLFTPEAGGKNCTLLSAVNTATGKQQWTKTLSGTKGTYGARVAVTDSRVIAVGDSKAVGYEAASGKQKWDDGGRGKFCTLSGSGSGNTVLLHSSCADSSPKEQIVALDATSGRLGWWRGLGAPTTVSVLSAEPAVVLTTGASENDDTIRSWDAKGNAGAQIPVARSGGRLDVGHGALDATPGVFFRGTAMAAALVPADGSTPDHGSLTVVDLKTGKQVWMAGAKEKGKVQPVGIDGDALVVATEERTDQPAHLSRFALSDGTEAAGGGFPRGTGSVLTSGRLLVDDTLVVAVPNFTSTYGTAATGFRDKG